jgi:lipoprotein-anchoring transpeptidase ErfK/SrfK
MEPFELLGAVLREMGKLRIAYAAALLGLMATASAAAGTADGALAPAAHPQLAAVAPAETLQPPAHETSDQALPAATEDSSASGASAAAPLLAPPEPTLFADIDLGRQEMTVSDKNGELGRWKISSARGGYKTPTGTYTVHYTSRMHYSKQYGFAPMPYSVFFNEGVAVHGTNAIGQLGQPASHGCVRAHPANAKIFYNLVQKHGMEMTRVTVHGKPPYSPAVAERPRRRYQPGYSSYGFFGGPPAYEQRKRQRYGAGNYGYW